MAGDPGGRTGLSGSLVAPPAPGLTIRARFRRRSRASHRPGWADSSTGSAADEHPGLSAASSLLSHGREAFIVRLALADPGRRAKPRHASTTSGTAIRPAGSSSTT